MNTTHPHPLFGLSAETTHALITCTSINQKAGFKTLTDIKKFWKLYGPTGFLNIKEITPDMVCEIRTNIIEKQSSTS